MRILSVINRTQISAPVGNAYPKLQTYLKITKLSILAIKFMKLIFTVKFDPNAQILLPEEQECYPNSYNYV